MPKLSFGQYQLIGDNIIEFIGDEGAQLDLDEASECVALYQQFHHPLGVLVNRSHTYSSSLEFIMTIAEVENVKAFAIWVPNERSAKIADSQKMFFPIPFESFYDRDDAIRWLKQQVQDRP